MAWMSSKMPQQEIKGLLCHTAEKEYSVWSGHCAPNVFGLYRCSFFFEIRGRGLWVTDGGEQLWEFTFQSDGLRAVEVQQRGEGAAVRVVLQQVLHQGERRSASLLSVLFPVASLQPWQRCRDITDMCHRQGGRAHAWRTRPLTGKAGIIAVFFFVFFQFCFFRLGGVVRGERRGSTQKNRKKMKHADDAARVTEQSQCADSKGLCTSTERGEEKYRKYISGWFFRLLLLCCRQCGAVHVIYSSIICSSTSHPAAYHLQQY